MAELTLALVRQVDAKVRSLATYKADPALRDSWTSYAKRVLGGLRFEGDCDDWAETALEVLASYDVPRSALFRALVASQGTVIDHMIGLVQMPDGSMWSIGDTFGPPARVSGDRVNGHLIIETSQVGKLRNGLPFFKRWSGLPRRETNTASVGLRTSAKGASLIKAHEELRLVPYDDKRPHYTIKASDKVLGTLTVGWGHTGRDVVQGVKIAKTTAEAMFNADLAKVEAAIHRAVMVELTQDQFDALASFVFNVGEAQFRSSTLLKKINARAPAAEIQAQFRRWTYSGGVQMAGLVRRRDAEAALWAGDVITHGAARAEPRSGPVEADRTVKEDHAHKSLDLKLLLGGSGAATVTVLAQVQEMVREFRDQLADSNMTLLATIASVALAVIAAVLLWKRLREIAEAQR